MSDLGDERCINRELKILEDHMPSLLEKELEKTAKSHKAKTGVVRDGFIPKFRWI